MIADTLIIGAGMSGLMAGHVLQEAACSIVIVDKGRSVGGRLGTRRIGNGVADHGAQFFSVRTAAFQQVVDEWLASDLVYEWSRGWSDGSLIKSNSDGYPRYAVCGGMNQLAKYLAQSITTIHINTRIIKLKITGTGWVAIDEAGTEYPGKSLIITSPVPQALQLLDDSEINLNSSDRASLARIEYGPCLCGLFVIEGGINLPEPGALQRPEDQFSWIADNHRKGISKDARVITVHAAPEYSQRHYNDPDDDVLADFQNELQNYLLADTKIVERQLKRWRYSIPLVSHPEPYLLATSLPSLIFAGDAFGGGARVEGAFLSGVAAGNAVKENM